MRLKKRTLVLLGAVVVAVGLAIGAYAYFTITGSGTTTSTVATVTPWTVTPNTLAFYTFFPGGGVVADGTVTNPGSTLQRLNKIVGTIEAPTLAPAHSGPNPCTAADFYYANGGGGSWVIAPDGLSATLTVNQFVPASGTYPWSGLTIYMRDRQDTVPGDGLGNQNDCQGATVNLRYDAS